MKHRALVRILLAVTLLFTSCSSKDQPNSKSVQRIILISIDDLRADYLGCYNPTMKTTPNLDRFAAENVLCKNVMSQAAITAISHKSILYSLYPSVHKTSPHEVPQEKLQSPIQILHSKGFKTAAFVGGGQVGHHLGFSKGFDTYWEQKRRAESDWQSQVGQWIAQNYKDNFFLFLHTYEVHCPFNPPASYIKKYAGWYTGNIDPRGKCGVDYRLMKMTSDDYRYIRDLYAASVNYMDDLMAPLFQQLKDLGIYDQTIIAFMADHGESLGERGYIGHNQLYNIQLHIPLILHIPGVPTTQIDSPLEEIDVMPTIFDAAGLGRPFPFQGRSLMPILRGQAQIERNRVLISENLSRVRVKKGNITCQFPRAPNGDEELYDLQKDPEETKNLAHDNPKLVQEMKALYKKMTDENGNISQQFVLRPGQKLQMDEESREQLKALGYADE